MISTPTLPDAPDALVRTWGLVRVVPDEISFVRASPNGGFHGRFWF